MEQFKMQWTKEQLGEAGRLGNATHNVPDGMTVIMDYAITTALPYIEAQLKPIHLAEALLRLAQYAPKPSCSHKSIVPFKLQTDKQQNTWREIWACVECRAEFEAVRNADKEGKS